MCFSPPLSLLRSHCTSLPAGPRCSETFTSRIHFPSSPPSFSQRVLFWENPDGLGDSTLVTSVLLGRRKRQGPSSHLILQSPSWEEGFLPQSWTQNTGQGQGARAECSQELLPTPQWDRCSLGGLMPQPPLPPLCLSTDLTTTMASRTPPAHLHPCASCPSSRAGVSVEEESEVTPEVLICSVEVGLSL